MHFFPPPKRLLEEQSKTEEEALQFHPFVFWIPYVATFRSQYSAEMLFLEKFPLAMSDNLSIRLNLQLRFSFPFYPASKEKGEAASFIPPSSPDIL